MHRRHHVLIALLVSGTLPTLAAAQGVVLRLMVPPDLHVKSALASSPGLNLNTIGVVGPRMIRFSNLVPDAPYTIRLVLEDGTILQGIDLGWYEPQTQPADSGPLTDDDRKQLAQLVTKLARNANKSSILDLRGTHQRAAVLCEFIRDKGLANNLAGQVFWRVEVWYFKQESGHWQVITGVNKLIRRSWFKDQEHFRAATEKLKWVPRLGGVVISAKEGPAPKTIRFDPEDKSNEK